MGPCRFGGVWTEPVSDEQFRETGLVQWGPLAIDNPVAWIQIAAVTKDQTVNTSALIPAMLSEKCKREHNIDVGKELTYAHHGKRRMECVTSSPRALEGKRVTFVVRNETHHWLANNNGHGMAAVIERNATKSDGGGARALSITNAYASNENSVAQQQREAWEAEHEGLSMSTGVLYDSLEMPGTTPLTPPGAPLPDRTAEEARVVAWLTALVSQVVGDATWLSIPRLVKSMLDRQNPPSRSRRWWLNSIVAQEDAWLQPDAIAAAADPLAVEARGQLQHIDERMRAGWLVDPSEPVVLFGDLSKSDDHTGLVACRLSDMYLFTVGHWGKPRGDAGKDWVINRDAVDQRVAEAHERFNVVGFYVDPGHASDDDAAPFWTAMLDKWHRTYRDRYWVWSTRTGDRQHAIVWDMQSPARTKQFTAAAEEFQETLETPGDAADTWAPGFVHDGHPLLMQQLRNARMYPNKYGTSIWKGSRHSPDKIDLAVCAVGARMLARIVLNRGETEEAQGKRAGEVWGI